jgi:integrase-like protein
VATIRKFIADWLHTKQPEVSAGTLAFYKKSTVKFLEFLGTAADLDLASITRTTVLEFRNCIAKRNSPVTTNADLKAIKMICRAAKRDGYIAEDSAEFVETVRKSSEQARRSFTTSEIQKVISVADAKWKSLILFGLYTGQRLSDIDRHIHVSFSDRGGVTRNEGIGKVVRAGCEGTHAMTFFSLLTLRWALALQLRKRPGRCDCPRGAGPASD